MLQELREVWFNAEKGLRLHRPARDGSADVFVWKSQGSGFRAWKKNQKVEFEVGRAPRAAGRVFRTI